MAQFCTPDGTTSILIVITLLQDVFNPAVHWLQACGVFAKILDPYMNKETLISLPKKSSSNEPLTLTQLIMLWMIWVCGMTAGMLAFLVELKAGSRRNQGTVNLTTGEAWTEDTSSTE